MTLHQGSPGEAPPEACRPAGSQAASAARPPAAEKAGAAGSHPHLARRAWQLSEVEVGTSRKRPSQTTPGRAGTGGAIAAASRAMISPGPETARRTAAERPPASPVGAPPPVPSPTARRGETARRRSSGSALRARLVRSARVQAMQSLPGAARPILPARRQRRFRSCPRATGRRGSRDQRGGGCPNAVAIHAATDAAGAGALSCRRWTDRPPTARRPPSASPRRRTGGTPSSGRSSRTVANSTSGAMPAIPPTPLPPKARMSSVSAWSAAWCPSSRWTDARGGARRGQGSATAPPGRAPPVTNQAPDRRSPKRRAAMPRSRKPRRGLRCLRRRFRAQAMIDDESQQRAAALTRPAPRQTVPAPCCPARRTRRPQARCRLEGAKRDHRRRKLVGGDHRGGAQCGYLHPPRWPLRQSHRAHRAAAMEIRRAASSACRRRPSSR